MKKPGMVLERLHTLKAVPISDSSADSEMIVGNTGSQMSFPKVQIRRAGTTQSHDLAKITITSPVRDWRYETMMGFRLLMESESSHHQLKHRHQC